jgi:NADH dehydrogenase [ubiquinone] 1 alpha subcomplex assembly factor 7
MTDTPADILKQRLTSHGPISVSDFMAWCLTGWDGAYYRKGVPLGAAGDFITAPEISQIFGELIGLWAWAVWQSMGAPLAFSFVELGPGRGTLMADALRATSKTRGFLEAARIHLVEASVTLREIQAHTLKGTCAPVWHDDITTLPSGPAIVIANEFLDVLPVEQHIYSDGAWHLRMVGLNAGGKPAFMTGPPALPPVALLPPTPPSDGDILESHPDVPAVIAGLASGKTPLAMLFIDYGYSLPAYGDTFQAVRNHTYVDPFETPGAADLTSHVNFTEIRLAAQNADLKSWELMPHNVFLKGLGLELRLEQLLMSAQEKQHAALISGARRLVDPAEMGTLFKVMAIAKNLSAVPPFTMMTSLSDKDIK